MMLGAYRLVPGTDAHNPPFVVRPTDFDATTNARVWKLLSFSWGNLDNIPESFPPAIHFHPVTDVNGLALALSAKEPALGNPSTNSYVLSSTTAGVRSWIAQPTAFPGFGSNHATAAYGDHTHAYAPLTGTGTSGTWPINVSGNAATATTAESASTVPWSGISSRPALEGALGNPASSGYVLSSDTYGNRSWVALPSAGVAGSGTSGTLPIWTGSGTQGDSLVSWSKPGAYDIVAVNAILDLQGHNLAGVGNVLCTAVENTYGSLALIYGNGQNVSIFGPSGIETVIDGSGVQSAFKSSDGTAGMTATKTIYARNSDNTAAATHTVTIKDGLITAWTTNP